MKHFSTLSQFIFAGISFSKRISFFTFLTYGLISLTFLLAQETDTRSTVAVLDFEGRGISQLEAQTLTDRFRTSIGITGAIRLVERNLMEEILQEQGFQQTGCTTDECAVEVGKLLGVQFMIGGAIGKIGETYTIDARMISIETGATERAREITYIGKVDGLIIEIEILAYIMAGLEPTPELLEKRRLGTQAFLEKRAQMVVKTRTGALIRSLIFPGLGQFYSEKKLWGYGWLISEIAVGALIYTSYSSYQKATDNYNTYVERYNQSTNPTEISDYKDKVKISHGDIETSNDQMKLFASVAAGLWLANAVHAYLVGPKGASGRAYTEPSLKLAYDPHTRQAQVRFEIALD